MHHDVHPEWDDGALARAVDAGDVAEVREVLAQLGPSFRLSRLALVRRATGNAALTDLLCAKARIPAHARDVLQAELIEHVPVALLTQPDAVQEPYRVVFHLEGERVLQDNGPLRAPEVVHGLKGALERLIALYLYEREAPDADEVRSLVERIPAIRELDTTQLAFAAAITERPERFVWSAWLDVTEDDDAEGWLTVLSLDCEDAPRFGCLIQAAR